jgi:hypothetical protein
MANISRLLLMVATPHAEVARALTMRLATLRIRTRLGPKRDVTPVATLLGSSARVWSDEKVHRVWDRSAVVSRP